MKKIEVCIGTDRVGHVRARLSLIIIDDDTGEILAENYHSISLPPGANYSAARAAVENHLGMPAAESGIRGGPWPAIPNEAWADVEAHCSIVHKPAVVTKYQAMLAAQAAAMEALKGNK